MSSKNKNIDTAINKLTSNKYIKLFNETNIYGETPLHIACQKNSSILKKTTFIISKSIESIKIQDFKGYSPIHCLCSNFIENNDNNNQNRFKSYRPK